MRVPVACLCASLVVLLASCTTGPRPPQPGTPAFYWSAAQETYRLGDFMKTADNLAAVTKTENEFTARARVWEIVVSSGLTQAYMELADSYEAGARANRKNPMPFRRQVSVFRSSAAGLAVQSGEAFHRYLQTDKDAQVAVSFHYPLGSPNAPPEIRKAAGGILLPAAELERLQRAMLQRGVVLAACRAVGAGEDAAKAQEIFKTGQFPRETFLVAMADMLHDQALLFGPTRLDQPNRLKMLCEQANQALAAVPPSKNTKELGSKIEKTLKKVRTT